uniref:DNA-directed RNA polymerases I and III subunit RPAC1 n=1 Tax=Percolomonas cosmopolitus TaxID=63605 RepID=A0A7S1KSC8_9EUKA|eukprot:CAMPEP_0117450582 /NCGR_PEP_ID=MMETSP0759-20121206/8544_1 /TAXON_ID=63605 /ORGANISM="Percolomonas cosmopolitus, Strain WS" /LENGTH=384 /DNA_ID=CAMNT_0005243111 /DNA_START=133 /DNA_END=1287 /DNA_ORIENTATION=+
MPSKDQSGSAVNKIRDFLRVDNDAPKHTRSFAYHSSFQQEHQPQTTAPKITVKQLKKTQKHYNLEKERFDEIETDEEMLLDVENITPAMANALRRIMIAEVPTMAVHYVVINRNTSILKDEILAHRLGLIPILADPSKFRFKSGDTMKKTLIEVQSGPNRVVHNRELPSKLYETETILFQLKVKCKRTSGGKIVNSQVFSRDLKWVPFGNQAETFTERPIRAVHDDILIAKLAPGQELDIDLYCEKGTGADHAKFSPVATATYRLLPHIEFKQTVRGNDAKYLVQKCPMRVFDIEDDVAVVANQRHCTMCRECIREDGWENKIGLFRKKQHFIFSIESTGIMTPSEIFKMALKVLYTKAYNQLKEIEAVEATEIEEEENVATFK